MFLLVEFGRLMFHANDEIHCVILGIWQLSYQIIYVESSYTNSDKKLKVNSVSKNSVPFELPIGVKFIEGKFFLKANILSYLSCPYLAWFLGISHLRRLEHAVSMACNGTVATMTTSRCQTSTYQV